MRKNTGQENSEYGHSRSVGVLEKAVLFVILKCSSSASLASIFEKYMWRIFYSGVAGVKPATLFKNNFPQGFRLHV